MHRLNSSAVLSSAVLSSVVLIVGALACTSIRAAEPESLIAQRNAFIEVYPAAERGAWTPVEEREDQLASYILWPDLKAAYLRAMLNAGKRDPVALNTFLDEYGHLRPGRDIRYRYARSLGRAGQHSKFLALYEPHYADSNDATLDCFAAQALQSTGKNTEARSLATRLWLTGSSQRKECDPVFAAMKKSGWLTESLLKQRFELAIAAREFSLARYIARSLDESHLEEAQRWIRAGSNPASFVRRASPNLDTRRYRQQLGYAVERLAVRQPATASAEWLRLKAQFDFNNQLDQSVSQRIALWATRRQVDGLEALLGALPASAIDNEVLTWQARISLGNEDWQAVLSALDRFADGEASKPEWRYWRAVALEHTAQPAEAMLAYSVLARERDYYGFLAADAIGVDYAMDTVGIAADESILERLASRPELLRAAELFRTGLDGRARSEWQEATRNLSTEEKVQAVLLAERWNWPSRAISLAARTGRFDSLESRYPLPHYELFEASAAGAKIPVSWAYGVARSESLFMRDIRSSAGAIGLMQLMPATGKRTAREIKLPYRGLVTLTDPESNIRLGSSYLAKMNTRFDGNPAVATAAYNAGPARVARWLPKSGAIDARVWVESIPFRETRNYVRRVLTADIIFEWRLTGKAGRLSDRLPEVLATGESERRPTNLKAAPELPAG